MGKLVTVSGRTLIQSSPTPSTLIFSIVETDLPATKACGEGKELLLRQITLQCTCSGDYAVGQRFAGNGTAVIVADTKRVKCEGKSLLLEGDKVTINCTGTITNTSSGATSPGTASVTVTITNANQQSIFSGNT